MFVRNLYLKNESTSKWLVLKTLIVILSNSFYYFITINKIHLDQSQPETFAKTEVIEIYQ